MLYVDVIQYIKDESMLRMIQILQRQDEEKNNGEIVDI